MNLSSPPFGLSVGLRPSLSPPPLGLSVGLRPNLSDARIGERVRIVVVDLDAEITRWLSAVGLFHGEEIVVLRRAALGGPLHVRVVSGGEFAVGRELAERIAVEPEAA